MNAPDLVSLNPSFYNDKPATHRLWHAVARQARRHTRRVDEHESFDMSRPNESESVKQYRDLNRRNLTTEGVYKFMAKASRIFSDSGFDIDAASLSPNMAMWLESKPFLSNGMRYDVFEFFYRIVLPFMIEDANGLIVALPSNMNDVAANQMVEIQTVLVPSSDIVHMADDVVAWKGERVTVDKRRGLSAMSYWLLDAFAYYTYTPVRYDNGKYVYRLDVWYIHDAAMHVTNVVGGMLALSDEGAYFESMLRAYFELADEVIPAFSDNQAIRVSHAYPKTVMSQIPCPAPDCKVGKRRIYDVDDNVVGIEDCPTCMGSGRITNPGPFDVLIRPSDIDGQSGSNPIIEYITPPSDILQMSYDVAFDLLTKAKRTIGLDLLENVQESGVAKSLRLQDLHDFLMDIANLLFTTMQRHLHNAEQLLTVTESARREPRIQMPNSLQLTSAMDLAAAVNDAVPIERYDATLNYISRKYRGDAVKIRVYELAMKWAPVVMVPPSELPVLLSNGVYTPQDVERGQSAVLIFSEIARENDILTMSDGRAIQMAEMAFERMQNESQINEMT